jgi:hypothetical protein
MDITPENMPEIMPESPNFFIEKRKSLKKMFIIFLSLGAGIAVVISILINVLDSALGPYGTGIIVTFINVFFSPIYLGALLFLAFIFLCIVAIKYAMFLSKRGKV